MSGAAAVMGQLRNLLRAFAWDHPDEAPSGIVARLDGAMREFHINRLATAIFVRVERSATSDPAGSRILRWVNAGHPAPILIAADGTPTVLDSAPDLLLGVAADTTRTDHTALATAGSTLLLYTDGLVESREPALGDGECAIDVGLARLLQVVTAHHHLTTGDLLDRILADMVGEQPIDDVAVLVVRFGD